MPRANDRSPCEPITSAEFLGNLCGQWNPLRRRASPIPEPAKLLCRPRIDPPKLHHLENKMVITSAHISPIMALVAGILILIMPRLLNFIVAIYLILFGLIGLGLLHWLHM